MAALVVGDLTLEVRRSARRRTMQITVDRGGELILTAPPECMPQAMEDFVKAKRLWIYTKLAGKEEPRPEPPPEKQYVSGEGFLYLGRSHRMLLVAEQDAPVKLVGGRFVMRRADAPEGRRHMVRWYTERARPWIEERVLRYAPRVDVSPSGVVVQDLGYRWGSCGKRGRLYFHWKTILLPARIVEYVVVHELCHLLEAHHTTVFWQRMERTLPDATARKAWLAEHGADYTRV